MNIVYMGTPDFAVTPLKECCEKGYKPVCVVTQQDKAKNRGKKIQFTPVKKYAVSQNIPVLQPERVRGNEEFYEELKKYSPDVIIVAAYGQILPKEILELPPYGCINIHASLLPRHRGAAPIQRVILDGDQYAGVTIMEMGEGLDTGDMILKDRCPVGEMTADQLHDTLSDMGAELIMKVLKEIEKGNRLPAEPQEENLATYAPMIFKEDGKIDFTKSPEEIVRLIRAMDSWPGAYTFYKGELLKIWHAFACSEKCDRGAGTIISADERGISISAGGRILIADVIQVPGKKRIKVSDFLRGNTIEEGIILE